MTLDAISQQMSGARDQIAGVLKTSPAVALGLVALLSCGTTPIEAVVADPAPPDAVTEVTAGGSPNCEVPSAGRFVLTGETGCLRRGEATTVYGNPAFMVELSVDCTSPRAQWDLTPAVAGTFTLRNVENELSLDVRTAADLPGTPIILYQPNTLDNQRFWFRSRSSTTYELAPRHAPALCASARGSAVEIWPCQTDDSGQVFHFSRLVCP